MPVSPLSEAMLCLLTGVLRWLDGAAVVVHRDSLPGNHAGEQSRPKRSKRTVSIQTVSVRREKYTEDIKGVFCPN